MDTGLQHNSIHLVTLWGAKGEKRAERTRNIPQACQSYQKDLGKLQRQRLKRFATLIVKFKFCQMWICAKCCFMLCPKRCLPAVFVLNWTEEHSKTCRFSKFVLPFSSSLETPDQRQNMLMCYISSYNSTCSLLTLYYKSRKTKYKSLRFRISVFIWQQYENCSDKLGLLQCIF